MEGFAEIMGMSIVLVSVFGGLMIPIIALYIDNEKRKERHKERLVLLEKGVDPQQIWPQPKSKGGGPPNDPLLWGMLFAGVGLGLLTGYFVALIKGWNTIILMNGSAILLGGAALILYNFIKRSEERKRAI